MNNLVDAMSTWCTAGILFNLLSPKVLVISRARFPARSPVLLPAEQLSRFAFRSTRHQMALRERPRPTDFQTRDLRIICCALVNIQIVEYISRSCERRASFLRVRSNSVCDSLSSFIVRNVPIYRECRSLLRGNGFIAFSLSNYQ